jgi:hypothetical protein
MDCHQEVRRFVQTIVVQRLTRTIGGVRADERKDGTEKDGEWKSLGKITVGRLGMWGAISDL